jgi:hypothetical protein
MNGGSSVGSIGNDAPSLGNNVNTLNYAGPNTGGRTSLSGTGSWAGGGGGGTPGGRIRYQNFGNYYNGQQYWKSEFSTKRGLAGTDGGVYIRWGIGGL